MNFLRQSTASQEVPLDRFVDSTDGNTEKTALTIANTDIKIWKTGATTLASKNSGGATHIANGVYYCVLDATDTDTIGALLVTVHVAGALYVRVPCTVLDEAVYDALFGTTALSTLDAAAIRSAVGLGSANLDTQLSAIAAYIDTEVAAILAAVDTEVAAIKAKTDQLTFTNANKVDSSALVLGADVIDSTALAASAVTELVAGVFAKALAAKYGSLTFEQWLGVVLAILAGKTTGMDTASAVIRDLTDGSTVLTATTDASGNRSVPTITP